MTKSKAKNLGELIRKKRQELGYSMRELAKAVGVENPTLLRIEQGEFKAPSPEILARIAEGLRVPLADLYSVIGYSVPADLPSPSLYLRAKYRDLPKRDLATLAKEVEQAFVRQGIDPNDGPKDGEDESPETKPRTRTQKKGGRR